MSLIPYALVFMVRCPPPPPPPQSLNLTRLTIQKGVCDKSFANTCTQTLKPTAMFAMLGQENINLTPCTLPDVMKADRTINELSIT